jgi:hypothetical protein
VNSENLLAILSSTTLRLRLWLSSLLSLSVYSLFHRAALHGYRSFDLGRHLERGTQGSSGGSDTLGTICFPRRANVLGRAILLLTI